MSAEPPLSYGATLRDLCTQAGRVSQDRLAEDSGLTKNTIHNLQNDITRPQKDSHERIMHALEPLLKKAVGEDGCARGLQRLQEAYEAAQQRPDPLPTLDPQALPTAEQVRQTAATQAAQQHTQGKPAQRDNGYPALVLAGRRIVRVMTSREQSARPYQWATAVFAILLAVTLVRSLASQTPPSRPTPATNLTAVDPRCAPAPTLDFPVDGQVITSSSVIFLWHPPAGCLPQGYTYRLSQNQDGEVKPWTVDEGDGVAWFQFTFAPNLPNGTYYWHVWSCKPCSPYERSQVAVRSIVLQR